MPRDSAQATLTAVLVTRGILEAALFAALAAASQRALGGGAHPVPVMAVALALTGAGIILASVLRDARAGRQHTAIAAIGIGAAAAFGVSFSAPHPEGLEILTRLVLFGILGEAFVWRNLSLARGLIRWTDTRNAGFAAIGALALVAIVPGTLDRTGLFIAGIATTAAAGIALSLARSAEELALAGREARGGTHRSTASGTAIVVAVVALTGALLTPFVGDLLGRAGRTIAPIVGGLLFGGLLVLGYIAGLVVEFFRAFLNGRALPRIQPPRLPIDPAQDAETIREFEASRPFVLGAAELLIAAVAIILIVVLVDRMARERRQMLPLGGTLDRESAGGEGIGAFLGGLLPHRSRRAPAPRDDGTPAGALRALYWRYLARGEAVGVAWRAVGETPGEHQARAERSRPQLAAAATLVRAFEDLRYGEHLPDPGTLDAARAALAATEAAR